MSRVFLEMFGINFIFSYDLLKVQGLGEFCDNQYLSYLGKRLFYVRI